MGVVVIEIDIREGGYGLSPVLRDLQLTIPETGLHVLLGRNGVGKTTLLRAILGLLPEVHGHVRVGGHETLGRSLEHIVRRGVAFMPQEGGVFDGLTVAENLSLVRSRKIVEHCLDLFPVLRERSSQTANTLSGGERKMLGLTRTLAQDARFVLLDEPTEGVWHTLVTAALKVLEEMAADRCVLLVEQSALSALDHAASAHILEAGRLALSGSASDVRSSHEFESLLAI
jgi:branched-chain amino acid transport system ATP-binding protein